MMIKGSDPIIRAFNHVSTKAPKQSTKEGIVQAIQRTLTYCGDVQKLSALAGVEGGTLPT